MAPSPPSRTKYIALSTSQPTPPATQTLAIEIQKKYPNSGVLLYGSGISILKNKPCTEVLYDFYVIVPSYKSAYSSWFLRTFNRLIPPNVFYIEHQTPDGFLRAKYAILSISHFEKLVSKRTFHSYFWARFAQPCRIVSAPEEIKSRLIKTFESAIDTFIHWSSPLIHEQSGDDTISKIWHAGLAKSYQAELRAEQPERVTKLLDSYGTWPQEVTTLPPAKRSRQSTVFSWRLRSLHGGALSILRLLKGAFTFEGGIDYIAWKISRHAGFTITVRKWERKWPILGALFLARRYYRMRKETKFTDS